jgi:nitroreductase
MDIYELIKTRSSIRIYKEDPVPVETVVRIVDAASRAPSWANKQCWRFVIVDSKVEKILLGKATGQANIAKACETAPYVIVLCADTRISGSKNGLDYYLFDSALAMDNLMLAAHSENLATCIVGWFDEKTVKGVLNIPQGIKVIAFTPLGYSGETVLPRARRKKNEVMFHNTWGREVKE